MAKRQKAAAGRRRMDKHDDAMAAKTLLVLLGLVLLASACTSQYGGRAATASAASWDDGGGDNMQRRQAAMKEAVKVFADYNPAVTDPRALKRAMATVHGEMATLRHVFVAVGAMPEGSAKEEGRAAAKEMLSRHLGQLLPGGSVKITDGL